MGVTFGIICLRRPESTASINAASIIPSARKLPSQIRQSEGSRTIPSLEGYTYRQKQISVCVARNQGSISLQPTRRRSIPREHRPRARRYSKTRALYLPRRRAKNIQRPAGRLKCLPICGVGWKIKRHRVSPTFHPLSYLFPSSPPPLPFDERP